MKTNDDFQTMILQGIPDELPEPREYDPDVNHAPRRRDILTPEEKKFVYEVRKWIKTKSVRSIKEIKWQT